MDGESESANSFKFVADKVSFVNNVLPLLAKATTDDETPTPGYMYQEICNMTLNRGSYCNDVLDYLVKKLDKRSYHVKLKVLRILRFIVDNGHLEFRHGLRRKSNGLREASKYGGPPDPLHGYAPYILVRNEAKELCAILFDVQDEESIPSIQTRSYSSKLAGMGSGNSSAMQGFGNTPTQPMSLTESLVDGLKDLANKVLDQGQETTIDALTAANSADKKFSKYQPVQFVDDFEFPVLKVAVPCKPHTQRSRPRVKSHIPGVAGGGWDDDSDDGDGDGDDNGSQMAPLSSDDGSSDRHTCYDRQTPAPDEYDTERHLVANTVNKDILLLKRTDIEEFIKKCANVNCMKVIEYIGDLMTNSAHVFQLHCLQLCEFILRTDLVTPDELFSMCRCGLDAAYRGHHPQTCIKAKKVIRILEKLCVHPDAISDIISFAENDQNNTQSNPEASTISSQATPSVETEDMYVSSFDFIKTDKQLVEEDSSVLLHSPDSLCSVENISEMAET